MSPATIAVLSVSMSADAFAAAIGRGAVHRPTVPAALRSGLVFGVVEGITPIVGWSLGLVAAGLVEAIDHWIAFALLTIVGGRMILAGMGGTDAPDAPRGAGPWALVATAIGTSIDAAAVGVGLAFLGANIWIIAAAIGATTFVCATTGMLIGRLVGARVGRYAELLGGVALVALGTGILVDHLGLIG